MSSLILWHPAADDIASYCTFVICSTDFHKFFTIKSIFHGKMTLQSAISWYNLISLKKANKYAACR